MRGRYRQLEKEYFDQHLLEAEKRIKNLCWTVSGDYSLDVNLNLEDFTKFPYIALYSAVKQGAFGKYFDSEKLGMYVMKKIHRSAQEKPLLELMQLCMDTAVYHIIVRERPGIAEIRRRAFEDIIEHQETALSQTFLGRVKSVIIKRFLGRDDYEKTDVINKVVCEIDLLAAVQDTEDVIAAIDKIYNAVFDQNFEMKQENLKRVLDFTPLEIAKDAWQECMTDEQMEGIVKKYLSNLDDDMMRLDIENASKNQYGLKDETGQSNKLGENNPDKEAARKVSEYVKLNYGESYLTPLDMERKNYKLCKGIHAYCTLHYTNGILHNPVIKNNQYRFSQLQFEKNRMYYYSNHWIIKRNITILSDTLNRALIMRREDDICRSAYGQLVPSRLWKLERTDEKKLFNKKLRSDNSEFAVDILLDASGSQAKRQSQVSAQGYVISEALSRVGIAHRVSGYCTFWDYTILQRFRDYDDGQEMNSRIFEFRASANNRDGLAIKAVYESLMERNEDNKIMIVLSDGKPNDVGSKRPGTRRTSVYTGDGAVKDTAVEVRRARALGISVLGIFSGSDEDLSAEKKIYGKDFAYIRDISNFSRIVEVYLRRQLEKE